MMACASGEHIKEATLTARKAGKGQQDYLIVKMNDVLITSVQLSGSSEQPMESVSMQLRQSRSRVQDRRRKTARSTPGVQFKYDLKDNKTI